MGNLSFRSCCVPTYAEISSDVSEEYAPRYDLEQSETAIIHSGSSGSLFQVETSRYSSLKKDSKKSNKKKRAGSVKPTVSFVVKKASDSSSQQGASDSDFSDLSKSCDDKISIENNSNPAAVCEENIHSKLLEDIFTVGPMCGVIEEVDEEESSLFEPRIIELLKSNARDETLNFPFLTSLESVKFISNSRFMFIMRGLSGSGKSYLSSAIQSIYENSIICSADEYFLHDGQYEFNREGLQYAHKYCQERAYRACQGEVSVIIIDNTNIRYWEMKPYVKMAQEFCYTVMVVSPKTNWSTDTGELSKLNKHNVDMETIQRKLVDFMRPTPPRYYGWFLNCESVDLLKLNSTLWLSRACNLPKFLDDFNFDLCCYFEEVPYKMHCTSLFCGDKSSHAVQRYSKDPVVISSFGKVFLLHVVGYYVTEDCWGAIVNLSDDQLELYAQNDQINKSGAAEPVLTNFRPGVRAHITIGTRNSVQPVKCGYDLLEIAKLHVESGNKEFSFVSGGVLVRYGHRVWGMYPSSHLHISACFAGGY